MPNLNLRTDFTTSLIATRFAEKTRKVTLALYIAAATFLARASMAARTDLPLNSPRMEVDGVIVVMAAAAEVAGVAIEM